MYTHHETSIQNLIAHFEGAEGVAALILGGSVAKGLARPDSDIDAVVVVTEEKYAQLEGEGRLAECVFDKCTYEGGYFDLKYTTKNYLRAVDERGSEPSRNAFACARVLFSSDDEISVLVPRLGAFREDEREEKLRSFYAALTLSAGYFWRSSADNPYLRTRMAADIVLYGCRMLLQHARVLFPCHKALLETVARLEPKPEGIIGKGERLLRTLEDGVKDDFVGSILAFIDWQPPPYTEVLTTFVDDNELWWYKGRPALAEW